VLIGIVAALVVVAVSAWAVSTWGSSRPDDAADGTRRESLPASRDRATSAAPVPSTATTTTAPDRGPPFAVGVVHVTLVDPMRGVAARGETPAASERDPHHVEVTRAYRIAKRRVTNFRIVVFKVDAVLVRIAAQRQLARQLDCGNSRNLPHGV